MLVAGVLRRLQPPLLARGNSNSENKSVLFCFVFLTFNSELCSDYV